MCSGLLPDLLVNRTWAAAAPASKPWYTCILLNYSKLLLTTSFSRVYIIILHNEAPLSWWQEWERLTQDPFFTLPGEDDLVHESSSWVSDVQPNEVHLDPSDKRSGEDCQVRSTGGGYEGRPTSSWPPRKGRQNYDKALLLQTVGPQYYLYFCFKLPKSFKFFNY